MKGFDKNWYFLPSSPKCIYTGSAVIKIGVILNLVQDLPIGLLSVTGVLNGKLPKR